MVVGSPDVDEVVPAALELVAVVRDVVAEIRGGAVGLHQHAVARVAEVGGAEPGGAVGLEHDAARAEVVEHPGDPSRLVERALGEPGVEVHAEATEVVAQPVDGVAVPPVAGLVDGDVVAQLDAHAPGHLDHVPALVPVLGRLAAFVPREQRGGEGVELVAGVVEVVLPVHDGALGAEEVGEGVAHRDPAAPAGVEGPGGVGGDELEVDALALERPAVPVPLAGGHDGAEHLVQPRGPEVEVHEAGAGHLGALERARALAVELLDQPGGDVAGWEPEGLGQLQRDIGGEVAERGVLGDGELDAVVGRGEPRGGERGVDGGDELVTDHGGAGRSATLAARRVDAW